MLLRSLSQRLALLPLCTSSSSSSLPLTTTTRTRWSSSSTVLPPQPPPIELETIEMINEQQSPHFDFVKRKKQTKTKVVATLGPATDSAAMIEKLINAGVDCFRLNFSHGSYAYHSQVFHKIREISARYFHQVAILCDIQGPKIRTGKMVAPFKLSSGDVCLIAADANTGTGGTGAKGTKESFTITYDTIYEDLSTDDLIYINDGIVCLRVVAKLPATKQLKCVVVAGGDVSDKKGCNMPSGNLSAVVPTPKDVEDLKFIAQLDPEYVAASFVSKREDIQAIRSVLTANNNRGIKIISKIERPSALHNIDDIIDESDGVMVARGDLGVEIQGCDVPLWQKLIVKKSNKAGKPVIIATQMLESMTHDSRPTRAEVSDVFNAVLDGCDAVMLSGETSVGKYPIEAVNEMDKICWKAEYECGHITKRDPDEYDSKDQAKQLVETVGHGVFTLTKEFNEVGNSVVIMAVSKTGKTVRLISKYRPLANIFCFTDSIRTAREANLLWGVRSVYSGALYSKANSDLEKRIYHCVANSFKIGIVKPQDVIITVAGSMLYGSTEANRAGTVIGCFRADEILQLTGEII